MLIKKFDFMSEYDIIRCVGIFFDSDFKVIQQEVFIMFSTLLKIALAIFIIAVFGPIIGGFLVLVQSVVFALAWLVLELIVPVFFVCLILAFISWLLG